MFNFRTFLYFFNYNKMNAHRLKNAKKKNIMIFMRRIGKFEIMFNIEF